MHCNITPRSLSQLIRLRQADKLCAVGPQLVGQGDIVCLQDPGRRHSVVAQIHAADSFHIARNSLEQRRLRALPLGLAQDPGEWVGDVEEELVALDEVGGEAGDDDAWVADGGRDARAGEAGVQGVGEEDVGQLGLAVCAKERVGVLARLVPAEGSEVDGAEAVGAGADVDDAAWGGSKQRRQEQAGEQVVAEVVDANLHLKALGCRLVGRAHHPCVVDEDVQARHSSAELVGKRPHRLERGQLQRPAVHPLLGLGSRHRCIDLLHRLAAPLRIPAGNVHRRAHHGEPAHSFQPDACVAARDEDDLARHVLKLRLRAAAVVFETSHGHSQQREPQQLPRKTHVCDLERAAQCCGG
eukprot:m.70378 g.70378  ORF g.70378 m.70378 type:complete len:355 (-) comp14291_c0_seq1:2-1066(-)